ncbi:uncharacterized protein EDB93DRAFT_1325913 [Suillus bovinus]|uniref:uncharacterized protein n=1 Tax=Suillus bovinus TaxID=48563 RepID=UPI001B87E081|nr:uncharacterized protein EDB93DRAFT_1325913 [Suillus bovinus]KAG2157684.1 hypothetical protein EDB93DRAFT_1325913 [Suillus bovinus]
MAAFVKKLTFQSNNLGADLDLVLAFDSQPIDDLYKNCYPLAFAVRKFGANGTYRSDVTYRSQLAFTKVTVSHDDIEHTSIDVPIQVGQSTALIRQGFAHHFSHPKTDPSVPNKNIQCTNNVPFKEDIGIGFIEKEGGKPRTVLVWHGLGHGHKVNVEFTPVLRGYIGTDYKDNCLIKGQIETDRLFEQDLTALEDDTTWTITYDSSTKVFSIKKI